MADDLNNILANLEEGLNETDKGSSSSSPLIQHIVGLSSDDVRTQERSLREIINATLQESNREIVTQRDGLSPIIKLLHSGKDNNIRTLAAHALSNLALYRPARLRIGREDGVSALVEGITTHDDSLQERSLAALCNLCSGEEELRNSARTHVVVPHALRIISSSSNNSNLINAALMFIANVAINVNVATEISNSGGVSSCARHIDSNDNTKQKFAIFALAALSCNPTSHAELEVFIQKFIRMLQSNSVSPEIQMKLLTILVNVSGHGPATEAILSVNNAVTEIVQRLSRTKQEQVFALQIIQNLALCEKGRDYIHTSGGVEKLSQILLSADTELAVHALLATTNLCVNEQIRTKMRNEGAIPAIEKLKNTGDQAIQSAISGALNNLRG